MPLKYTYIPVFSPKGNSKKKKPVSPPHLLHPFHGNKAVPSPTEPRDGEELCVNSPYVTCPKLSPIFPLGLQGDYKLFGGKSGWPLEKSLASIILTWL